MTHSRPHAASVLLAIVCFGLLAAPASAQVLPVPDEDPDQERQARNALIYMALSSTPVGALAPTADPGRLPGIRGGLHLTGHAAFIDQQGVSNRNFALSLGMPVPGGTLRATGGFTDYICDEDDPFASDPDLSMECNSGVFAGLDVTVPFMKPPMGSPNGGGFAAGLALSLGASMNDLLELSFTDPFEGTRIDVTAKAQTMSAAIGVPLSLVARAGDILVVPHVTPRLAYGRATVDVDIPFFGDEERTESGFKFMAGAGVDILFGRSGFGLSYGLQRIFDVDDAEMTVGFGLSYRAR